MKYEHLDIAHLSLIESIRDMIVNTGTPATKGNLIRSALAIANQIPETNYENMDAWEKALQDHTHPLCIIEQHLTREGNIFILHKCPFAPAVVHYMHLTPKLPEEYSKVMDEFNKPSKITDDLNMGQGSAASPGCLLHQPMRAGIVKKIRVGGKKVEVVQLGCKLMGDQIAVIKDPGRVPGMTREKVAQYLKDAFCVYAIKTIDE